MESNFSKEFATRLTGKLSTSDIKTVLLELDVFIDDYNIERKTTDIVVYTGGRPQFYETFFACKALSGAAHSSIKHYKFVLDKFLDEVNRPIEDITTNTIRAYLARMMASGRSKGYIDNIRVVLNVFFSWAYNGGYIVSNPMRGVEKIKHQEEPRKPLTSVELEKIRDAATSLRDSALIEFMYATGARVSEVTNVKIKDVDFQRSEVVLFGKGSKFRTVYINERTSFRLITYLNSRHDTNEHLFVTVREPHDGLTVSGVQSIIGGLARSAGIERHIHPHLLRHTFATDTIRRGANITTVQRLLGHESSDTTMIYAHIAQESVKAEYQKYVV